MSSHHTLTYTSDGVLGWSEWNWANTLHNVKARNERCIKTLLKDERSIKRWARGKEDVSMDQIVHAIAHLKTIARPTKPATDERTAGPMTL